MYEETEFFLKSLSPNYYQYSLKVTTSIAIVDSIAILFYSYRMPRLFNCFQNTLSATTTAADIKAIVDSF